VEGDEFSGILDVYGMDGMSAGASLGFLIIFTLVALPPQLSPLSPYVVTTLGNIIDVCLFSVQGGVCWRRFVSPQVSQVRVSVMGRRGSVFRQSWAHSHGMYYVKCRGRAFDDDGWQMMFRGVVIFL
jgi:hypothetical protein